MVEAMDTLLASLSPLIPPGGADTESSGLAVNTADANSTGDSFAQQLQAVHKEIDRQQPDSDGALEDSPDSTPVSVATDDTDLQLGGARPEVPALGLAVASSGTETAPAAGSLRDIDIAGTEQQQVVPIATGAGRSTSEWVAPDSIVRDAVVPAAIVTDSIVSSSIVPDSVDGLISQAAGAVSGDSDPVSTDTAKYSLAVEMKPVVNTASASEVNHNASSAARLQALTATGVSSSQPTRIKVATPGSVRVLATHQAVISSSQTVAANGYTGASVTGAELFASRTGKPADVLRAAVTVGAEVVEATTQDGGNSVRTRLDAGAFAVPAAVKTDVTGTSVAPLLVAADAAEPGQSTGIDAIANASAIADANAAANSDEDADAVIAKAVSQSLRAAIESSAGASLRIQNALDNVGNFSPENMFHATASGIVTAPTGLKPDSGPGTLIFAPQSVPLLTDEADGALSSNVRWMVNENIRQAVVNVTPSGMGPISIQMGIESEQMNVSIIAAQGATREALDAMLPRLREQMMAQGFENVSVKVSDSRPDQSLSGENSRQYADSDARDESTAESPFADFSTSGERSMRPDRHRGLFDVYV